VEAEGSDVIEEAFHVEFNHLFFGVDDRGALHGVAERVELGVGEVLAVREDGRHERVGDFVLHHGVVEVEVVLDVLIDVVQPPLHPILNPKVQPIQEEVGDDGVGGELYLLERGCGFLMKKPVYLVIGFNAELDGELDGVHEEAVEGNGEDVEQPYLSPGVHLQFS